MSNPTQPDLSDSHHYPPTTADWVSSPLAQQDELLHNPLEAPPSTIKPLLRLGAVLGIGGGLLAIAGSLMQFVQMNHLVNWYLWLVLLTSVLAIAAIGGSLLLPYRVTSRGFQRVLFLDFATIAAQLVAVVVTLTVANGRVRPGEGVWVSVVGILLLLVGGGTLRFVSSPEVSGRDLEEQTENGERLGDFTRGGNFLEGIPFGPRSGTFH